MADKKKNKKKLQAVTEPKNEPISKEMYSIAKWMRKNISTKRTKFLNHNVEYFTASKAVDALIDSPWSKSPKEDVDPLFSCRQDVVTYLDTMLRNKFFHRARKIPVSEKELLLRAKKKERKEGKKQEEKKPTKEGKSKEKGKEKEKDEKDDKESEKESKKDKKDDEDSSHAEGDKKEDKEKSDKADEQAKKRRKIRLDMHLEQVFVDGPDAYVWIYEPTPLYYWLFGGLMVFGAVAICLFPLWPPTVRLGVYYLSVAAAGFFIFIIALALIRLAVFALIWAITFGTSHLWLLPNLTEDVGFFASFWPLYKYDYIPRESSSGSKKKEKKKKKKAKDSDNENENDKDEHIETTNDGNENENDEVQQEARDEHVSEDESENSRKSSIPGKDFEMIEREDDFNGDGDGDGVDEREGAEKNS